MALVVPKLRKPADAGSTYVIPLRLLDEEDSLSPPLTLSWSLFNEAGKIVNGRTNQEFAQLASTMNLVLEGDDLPDDQGELMVLFDGTYNSTLGSNRKIRGGVRFDVVPLPKTPEN